MHLRDYLRLPLARTPGGPDADQSAVPPELPEGWAEALDLDTLEHLFAESRARRDDLLESAARQQQKINFVIAGATFAIGSTGLLERWAFDFTDSLFRSILSLTALVAWGLVLVTWIRALSLRERSLGVNPHWLALRALDGAPTSSLKAAAVEVQTRAVARLIVASRSTERLVTWAIRLLVVEVVALVVAEALRSAFGNV